MRIACLAWGSLVWKWAPLRITSDWMDDGPLLPIEFCRESDGGELSTALCPGAPDVPVLWALLAATDPAVARDELRRREQVPQDRSDGIGGIPTGGEVGPFDRRIATWAARHALDAVIWTALPPKSHEVEGRVPGPDEAIDYLDGLAPEVRRHAERYVRKVSPAIATPYRAMFEERLGWTADDSIDE